MKQNSREIPLATLETALLGARHAAQAEAFDGMLDELSLRPGARVLDVPCGDGFFTERLAKRVGHGGFVAAVDINADVLRLARERPSHGAPVLLMRADASKLPLADGGFRAVWCAHSLISLPDAAGALREFRRITRPGGTVGIVENDVFHDVLLPWPAKLELAVGRAEREAYRRWHKSPERLHIARRLDDLVPQAGMQVVQRRTETIDFRAPLKREEERFASLYLQAVWRRVRDYLSAGDRQALARLVDPRDPAFLPRQPHFAMTCLDVLFVARVPERASA